MIKKVILAAFVFGCLAFVPARDTVMNRFHVPANYRRINNQPGSFGAWLQQLPLKAKGTATKTYQGSVARTDPYTAAVVDISIGTQDLQQCADAVMRLRGEYLYQKSAYSKISFNFTSGFRCDFIHFANGYRYTQSGQWKLLGKKDFSHASFLRYMNLVFSYAGTLSLEKELKNVPVANDLETGDVFIHGGSPGHCFIVMDVVTGPAGKKQFMLAQSFMPAQNIQVLQQNGLPWFSMDKTAAIPYGELVNLKYLKRFN
jgi:hypothetical protein